MLISVCPNCGRKLSDDEVRDKYFCDYCEEEFTEDEVEFREVDDKDDIPEGCAACGGPYPYCKTSCKLFDD